MPYYLGAALTLWTSWQISTLVGIAIGSRVPDSLPLDFAVPLVFLVLLVPAVNSRPAAVAAARGRGQRGARGRAGGRDALDHRRRGLRDHGRDGRRAGERSPVRTDGLPRVSRVWMAIIAAGIGTFAMRASFLAVRPSPGRGAAGRAAGAASESRRRRWRRS